MERAEREKGKEQPIQRGDRKRDPSGAGHDENDEKRTRRETGGEVGSGPCRVELGGRVRRMATK